MKMYIVALRDSAVNAFSQPQAVASIGGYLRGLGDEVNRKAENNQLANHPGDFEAFELGMYDDADGSFQLHDKPRSIGRCADMVRS